MGRQICSFPASVGKVGNNIPPLRSWSICRSLYSPQLNPVKLMWSYLKGRLKNKAFTNQEELTGPHLAEVKRLEANHKLVQAFFHKEEVAFITD